MEDFYNDGFNDGFGYGYQNSGHIFPTSDGDCYDYRTGREEGEYRRRLSNELDNEN